PLDGGRCVLRQHNSTAVEPNPRTKSARRMEFPAMTGNPHDTEQASVQYDPGQHAVVIHHLAISDPSVVAEAQHWSTGQRGALCDEGEFTAADLRPFVSAAVIAGSAAIRSVGGV